MWVAGVVGAALDQAGDPLSLFQEEEDTKPKPAKRKRKGSSAVGSDSD